MLVGMGLWLVEWILYERVRLFYLAVKIKILFYLILLKH